MRGVIVYQQGEGAGGDHQQERWYALRDAGADAIDANVRLGMEVDLRRYGLSAEILRDLEERRFRLMSDYPKEIRALKNERLEMVERVSISVKFHRGLAGYLKTKRHRMGPLMN